MAVAQIVLEYLKVFLTAPVMAGAVALTFIIIFREQVSGLIARLATIRVPGGELSAPQLPGTPATAPTNLPDIPPGDEPALPPAIADTAELQERFNAERARAYLWEYRYLNLFLVPASQRVLEWFASLGERPTYAMYYSYWTTVIPDPSQRSTIISVLESHFLVQRQNDLLEITPKGREYLEWRARI